MRDRIERKAIIVGAVVGMIMAASGWLAYYLSGIEVLLLDDMGHRLIARKRGPHVRRGLAIRPSVILVAAASTPPAKSCSPR